MLSSEYCKDIVYTLVCIWIHRLICKYGGISFNVFLNNLLKLFKRCNSWSEFAQRLNSFCSWIVAWYCSHFLLAWFIVLWLPLNFCSSLSIWLVIFTLELVNNSLPYMLIFPVVTYIFSCFNLPRNSFCSVEENLEI